MHGGFRELENITADIGIEAWGPSVESAFASAANGLASLMSDAPSGPNPLTRQFRISADSLPSLLVQFLNEIVYLEETEGFLPGRVTDLSINGQDLDVTLAGDTYNADIHSLNAHIKAVTYHGLEIEEKTEEVRIRVIFDV